MTKDLIVTGNPSKSFFVEMITRDLTVEDCILDLIDNAIDEAVAQQGVNVMDVLTARQNGAPRFSDAKVSIEAREDRFVIRDNCGGISIAEARETVFRFGNPEERDAPGGLSVYGIGMKRSFFKLGRKINVESTTATERFRIDIDVDDWTAKGDNDWTFQFADAETLKEPPDEVGTQIAIAGLTTDTRRALARPGFAMDLTRRIESAYALFLQSGLAIKVNDKEIMSTLPVRVSSDDQTMTPARKRFQTDGVDVLVIAGVSPRDDSRRHGWYVFCNGRMVLNADRTEVTGWGRGLPKWHTKFGHFIGYVCFGSSDVRSLPWRTTKQGVVTDSAVYQRALAEMQVQARPVLNFLSKLYPGEVEEAAVHERDVMKKAKAAAITELPLDNTAFKVTARKPRTDPLERLVNIQYKRKMGDIEQVKKCVGLPRKTSAAKLGEYAFDYLVRQECPE